jgi:hypothetical protein
MLCYLLLCSAFLSFLLSSLVFSLLLLLSVSPSLPLPSLPLFLRFFPVFLSPYHHPLMPLLASAHNYQRSNYHNHYTAPRHSR